MRGPRSPQLRFLLRGSSLVIVMLALWWWLLLPPLLDGLRISTELLFRLVPGDSVGSIIEDDDGNWLMQAPLPGFVANSDRVQTMFNGGTLPAHPVKVRSIKLAAPRLVPSLFALTFPLYWAIMLAAPLSRRSWQPALRGTLFLAVLAQCSMLLYTVFTVGAKLNMTNGAGGKVLEFFEYLNMYVLPYMAPVLLALAMHPGLRSQVFTLTVPPQLEPPAPDRVDAPRRSRRKK